MSADFVLAGLGNPGPRYELTRHNIGFLALDLIASVVACPKTSVDALAEDVLRTAKTAGSWKNISEATTQEIELRPGKKAALFKPLSFMNLSGEPLSKFMSYYKFSPDQLLVLHDEIDLPLGSLRLKRGGGDGGHNGIRSIASCLGTPDFARLRVGVGRPGATDPNSAQSVSSWVLGNFSAEEVKVLTPALIRVKDAVLCFVERGLEAAQAKYNS